MKTKFEKGDLILMELEYNWLPLPNIFELAVVHGCWGKLINIETKGGTYIILKSNSLSLTLISKSEFK